VSESDRRRHRRYLIETPARLYLGRKALVGSTVDVSFGGLFLSTEDRVPPRQLGRLGIELPPDRFQFECHAMTVHSIDAGAEGSWTPGIGLQLFALDPAATTVWTSFIRYVQLRYPEVVSRNRPQAPADPDAQQRREFSRAPARLELTLGAGPDAASVYSRDVSAGGMFVRTDVDLPVGAGVVIEVVHHETLERFPIDAVVRWRNERRESAGLGVEFVGLDETRRQQFFDFIRSEVVAIDLAAQSEISVEELFVPIEVLAVVSTAPGMRDRAPLRANVVELGVTGLRLEAAMPIDNPEVLVRFVLPGEREPLTVHCCERELVDEDVLKYAFAFAHLDDAVRERIERFVGTRVLG
jgi:c-di-GMP-binding flagellar brake protein YcgR